MKTGPKLKGRQNPAPGGTRSLNQPDVSRQQLRSKAVAPTQGRTRNQPAVAPIPKVKPGAPVPNSYFANSRTDVHPKFNRHPHD